MILWLLPDGGAVPEKLLMALLTWFIATDALWPNYLSIDAPGLPWINPQRVVTLALLAVTLVSYSTSATMRRQLADALNTLPFLKWAFGVLWAKTLYAVQAASRMVSPPVEDATAALSCAVVLTLMVRVVMKASVDMHTATGRHARVTSAKNRR